MKRRQVALAALSLILLGLALRLPGLSTYLTPDERLWSGRSADFGAAMLDGNWAATTTSSHPGITTTWAGASGVTLRWLLAPPPDTATLADLFAALRADPNRLDMLAALRLPVVLLSVLGILLIFLLARRLYGDAVGLLAAGFLLFDPFLLAHTKILHLDGLLTISLSIAWLAFLAGGRTGLRRYDLLCGLMVGFALVTKSPAFVLLPLLAAGSLVRELQRAPSTGAALRAVALDALWLGLPALAIALILWPALWVDPVANIRRVLSLMTTYGQTGHELGNFWLGRPVESPGVLFYPAALLWRTTPATLIGLLIAALLSVLALAGRRGGFTSEPEDDSRPPWALWVFVLWFGVIIGLGDKKFDRYMLPVFPMLDLLAAWGWTAAARRLVKARQPTRAQVGLWLAGALLVVMQASIALMNRPSYLTAYNPLLGGIRTAERVLLIGWGEGLEKAAAYLNEMGDGGRAASWYGHNVFGPFYDGHSFDLYYDTPRVEDLFRQDIDYVVTYVNQVQREMPDASVTSRLGQPIYTVVSNGVQLASVYRWPKPFAHTGEKAVAEGWQLMGWEVGAHDPTRGLIPITLFWDQEALPARGDPDRAITAWMKDASGEVWATAEGTVTGRESASPGWSGRPVVGQQLTFHPPLGLPPGQYRVEAAPLGGVSVSLGEVDVQALRMSDLAGNNLDETGVQFGDELALAGYEITSTGGETIIDLLWDVKQTPESAYKAFLHLVDETGAIVAQQDVCLGSPSMDAACSPMTGWAAGDVIRQRLRLPSGEKGQLYVGLYHPETGERLPLLAGGSIVPDGRFPLNGANAEGAP